MVISVDLMTFQTGDIRNTSKKLAGAALRTAVDSVFPHGAYAGIDGRYSQAGQFDPSPVYNYLVINSLGV